MEKNQLNNLLSHYSGSSQVEAEAVWALSKKYPYSQVLHALTARTAKDHRHEDHQHLLQMAAVYSTDRSVLKEIMSVEYSQPSHYKAPSEKLETKKETKVSAKVEVVDTIDYAEEIIHDLERLQELRHNFEVMFMGGEDKPNLKEPIVQKLPEPKKVVEEKATEIKEVRAEKPKRVRKKSKRERIIEIAKELDAAAEPLEFPSKPKKKKKKKKKIQETDPLIEEIKATKKKIEPENERTKEQIQIIDQYIKSKPTITPPKITPEENMDLASTLKSGQFGDNVISETLAEILIRQGKKDKAIEVYKKLIWKFPQKRAYFAAQIDELRK